jgi:hypothetical protein
MEVVTRNLGLQSEPNIRSRFKRNTWHGFDYVLDSHVVAYHAQELNLVVRANFDASTDSGKLRPAAPESIQESQQNSV